MADEINFTPIVTGAPANAETVNNPLRELDDAIGNPASLNGAPVSVVQGILNEAIARAAADDALSDELADIIGDSGTSSTETVNARSAGNVGSAATTLTERLGWLEGAQNVYAAAYGFDDGASASANKTAIDAACDAAAAFAAPAVVWLPAGKFSVNAFTVDAGITIRGAGRPYHDRVGAVLKGGTILYNTAGTGAAVVTLSDGSGLMDLGVQTTDNRNAITVSGDDCIVLNVAALGDDTSVNHGCISTAGLRALVSNYYASGFAHGLVFKNSHNLADNLAFLDCGISSITLAGDGSTDCTGNVLSNIHSENTLTGSGGGFRIYTGGAGNDVYGNLIENFYIQNGGLGIYLSSSTSASEFCRYNRFKNGYIEAPQTSGVWISATNSVAGNGADYNHFSDITITDAASFGFNNQYGGAHNSLNACESVNSAFNGAWARYGVMSNGARLDGMILRLTKTSTTTVPTGTGSLTDIVWQGENDPHSMHATDSAVWGPVPIGNILYRIRACICFAAHATGMRRVNIQRSISGGAYSIVGPTQLVSPGNGTDECQVVLEFITTAQTSYTNKISVQQTSGGDLTVTTNSHLTIELLG